MKNFSSLSSVEKFIASIVNSTVNSTQKKKIIKNRMNHEAICAISVFQAKLYYGIHLIPKWPPFRYSFVFIQISL